MNPDLAAIIRAYKDGTLSELKLEQGFEFTHHAITLILESTSGYEQTHWISFNEDSCVFTEIVPGKYTLKTDTGRVIWHKDITASQVILEAEAPLELAADTESELLHCTYTEEIPDIATSISLTAGMESGALHLQLTT